MNLEPDFAQSPYTGWTRAHWEAFVERMVGAVEPYRSPSGARIDLPGPASGNGSVSDGIEGFARPFLAAASLVAGRNGEDPGNLMERYARGLAAAMDPASPEAWPRPEELLQTKVEAASLVLGLQMTRPWLWDRLDDRVRENTVNWLSGIMGTWYPPSNWVWFRIIVESFLRENGGPWSATDIEEDLAIHAWMRRRNGWLSDGPGRHYDHYVGWMLHTYPLLWTHLFDVPDSLCSTSLREQWNIDLGRYTDDVLRLTGADGSPLVQGRSLVYRFATAAPLWVAALTGAGNHDPGLLRRAASGIVTHFENRGAFEGNGVLSLGWHGAWPAMRQTYSGPGSPYWASKAALGLLLPQDHAVWTSVEQPLPVEAGNVSCVIEAPGWLVSGRKKDGFVTVVNHGSDHSEPGAEIADAPVYARYGYSTATVPPLAGPAAHNPLDNAVVLLDRDGLASHRTGFDNLFTRELEDGVLVGASQGRVRWIESDGDAAANFGTYQSGIMTPGPVVTVASAVRDGVEVRLARVDGPTDAVALRFGGWPVASPEPPRTGTGGEDLHPFAEASSQDLVSALRDVAGLTKAGIVVEKDASPLGEFVAIPWLATGTVTPGQVIVATVTLSRGKVDEPAPRVTAEPLTEGGHRITVAWHQGKPTQFTLPAWPAP
ncbi:DUF2264 domain-containing protein [Arthrobacter sp. StoSoilB5]|uniref:DUF2264 domain-containing protein n=1 Tax=Arthrobacter sp. StoSoilB5 TaxID=2830992 RepID=UPI001CC7A7FC|nr:DUF2264 domain-containing protein [Arthrobacter sp. StoSoilB5]BCW44871.1 hypothetical protein StoSoilB5_20550 [Arthrobacter sp. StoSoilB5]